VLLIGSLKSLRESFDKVKDQVESLSTRLMKLETLYDLTYKGEVQDLKARLAKLETYIHNARGTRNDDI
jgi:predicted nuclease with TOPRIM domain